MMKAVKVMKSSKYWKDRFTILEESAIKKGADYYDSLDRQYREAERRIESKISTWYQRFANNNNITLAEARRYLTTSELEELHWSVEEYIKHGKENAISQDWMRELENASAKVHISRLESLKLQLQQEVEVLYGNQVDGIDRLARQIYSEGYYHTAFEIQRGFNVGWEFASLDTRRLDKVISKPWTTDGRTFKDKAWTQKDELVATLHTELTQAIIRGDAPDRAIKTIAKKFDVAKSKAGRLVMTESAYFSSVAQKDCFTELDVERFEIVATLDSHTSPLCQSLDGKVQDMKDFEPGVTAPPFHPWCRTTTVPYFEDDYGERAARGADGKTYYVPSNMKYSEWASEHIVDANYGQYGHMTPDAEQYERYKKLLKNNSPDTLAKFKEIRYNSDRWGLFKSYKSAIESGELTALADFELYEKISKEIDEKIVGVVTSNGIVISGKSKHCIARVIGSVEQRRSGVSIDDIITALISDSSEVLPIKVLKNGRSQKFRGANVEVSVNPDTGNIIQVNPYTRRKKGKK